MSLTKSLWLKRITIWWYFVHILALKWQYTECIIFVIVGMRWVTSDRVLWLIRSEMKMCWSLHHDVNCVTDWQQTKSDYCLTGMEKSRIKATLNWLDDVKSSEEFRDATAQMVPTWQPVMHANITQPFKSLRERERHGDSAHNN